VSHEYKGPERRDGTNVEHRVTRLDTQMEGIAKDVQQLTSSVNKLFDAVDQLAGRLSNVGRPDWRVLTSVAGFALAFVAAIGGAVFAPLHMRDTYIETHVREQQDVTNQRLELIVNHFEKGLEQQDIRLQREVRDLDAAIVDRTQRNEAWIDYILKRELEGITK